MKHYLVVTNQLCGFAICTIILIPFTSDLIHTNSYNLYYGGILISIFFFKRSILIRIICIVRRFRRNRTYFQIIFRHTSNAINFNLDCLIGIEINHIRQ